MERLCLKAGTAVTSALYDDVVEVKQADTLQSRFFSPPQPHKEPGSSTVFERLQQDSQTRHKVKSTLHKPPSPSSVLKPSYRIEEVLMRKHLESQLKRERLKAKWEHEIMKEVLPAPRINEYSKQLAERHFNYGVHLRCAATDSVKSPFKSATPSLEISLPREKPSLDSRLVSMKLGKYSELVLPEDTQIDVHSEENKQEDSEMPIELAEIEATEKPAAPLPAKPSQGYKSLSPLFHFPSSPDIQPLIRTTTPVLPRSHVTNSAEHSVFCEESDPMEIAESAYTARSMVSDATVSRERAAEYQQMVKRHMALVGKKQSASRK